MINPAFRVPPKEAEAHSAQEGGYAIFKTFLNPLFSADRLIPKKPRPKRAGGQFIVSFEL
tara:strand:- start:39 stop:218 length:180 start_codon:yes stop_codon:yes gene_type:complete